MKQLKRAALVLWLRVLARLKIGNARRRLGQFNRKRGAASLISNAAPSSLSGVAEVQK